MSKLFSVELFINGKKALYLSSELFSDNYGVGADFIDFVDSTKASAAQKSHLRQAFETACDNFGQAVEVRSFDSDVQIKVSCDPED